MKKYCTTKSDLDFFESKVHDWQRYFGLIDWEINVLKGCRDKDNDAECSASTQDKTSWIMLSSEFPEKPDRKEIEKYAFHEVCELLLWQLREFSDYGYSRNLINEQIHYVIRILENTIFHDKK